MGQGKTRNKLCHCGSTKKYKHCCMDKDKHIKKGMVHKKITSILREAQVKECLYPDHSKCSGEIIKSHSIQNNKILSKLSENGELIMISFNASESNLNIEGRKIGRSQATIFTGFCSYHDKIVFQKIEDCVYKEGDLEQNALFAFRAFSKEYHAKLSAYNVFKENQTDIFTYSFLVGNEAAQRDCLYYYEIFKQILIDSRYDLLETKYIIFEEEFGLAVSSGITFNYDFTGNKINNLSDLDKRVSAIFLTIFPENGKTYCLFTYLKEDKDLFIFLDDQLIKLEDDLLKIRLSNLVSLCENTVFSPILWEKIGKENQSIILNRFTKNIIENDVPGELSNDYGFNFFT